MGERGGVRGRLARKPMPKSETTHSILPAMLQRYRDFRHPLTSAEAKVWQEERNRQLGFMFRRQHPMGGFTPSQW